MEIEKKLIKNEKDSSDMAISVGVFAYNEEAIIKKNLDSILRQSIINEIDEILVFSDGSTDMTNRIIKEYEKIDERIKAVISRERLGKLAEINKFLKIAKSDKLVISSADIILDEHCLEEVMKSLEEPNAGIVGVRVIPKTANGIIGAVAGLEWDLLDKCAREKPKFGELIGIKAVISNIEEGSVDEELIAEKIIRQGYKGVYNPNAIVFNFPPKGAREFVRQRRRIYCGHLELRKRKGYEVPTLNSFYVIKILMKNIKRYNFGVIIIAGILEGWARFLGRLDFVFNPSKHYIWKKVKANV